MENFHYAKENHCTKCGNKRGFSITYEPADKTIFDSHATTWCEERIKIRCPICNYYWHEKPLDAEVIE